MLPLLETVLAGSNKVGSIVSSEVTTGEKLETAVTP
jgi:hypothetical protein